MWARFDAPELVQRCNAIAVREAKAWRGVLLVLRGLTGSGKTSLATAIARRSIDGGREGTYWIDCEDLSPDAPNQSKAAKLHNNALRGRLVILDDVGADLCNAPENGGIASIRSERVRRIIRHRYKHELRTVITTKYDDDKLKAWYGDDTLRRFDSESALVIRMRPQGVAK
jgi:DNA replication protein DnaC